LTVDYDELSVGGVKSHP